MTATSRRDRPSGTRWDRLWRAVQRLATVGDVIAGIGWLVNMLGIPSPSRRVLLVAAVGFALTYGLGWALRRRAPSAPLVQLLPSGSGLPPDIDDFVGREEQLGTLRAAVDSSRAVAVIGAPRIGTSAFVLHAAHRMADDFPGGMLYLNLRTAPGARPLTAARLLRDALRFLDLPEPQAQDDEQAAAHTLHAALQAGERFLLVLDNVDDPALVTQFLPRTDGYRLLFAGSSALDTLSGVRCQDLDTMTGAEAIQLLARTRDRPITEAERPDAAAIVSRLAHRPLAIRLLGRLLAETGLPLRHAATYTATRAGEPLAGIFALTYRDLSRGERRVFQLLEMLPVSEIGSNFAAELTGLAPGRAEQRLDSLVRAGLLEKSPGTRRYRLRRQLHLPARVVAGCREPAWRRRAALRLARYAAQMARKHAEALRPRSGRVRTRRRPAISAAQEPQARQASVVWFRAEQGLLHELVIAWSDPRGRMAYPRSRALRRSLFHLATALCTLYAEERRLGDWAEIAETFRGPPGTPSRREDRYSAWACNELAVVARLRGARADGERYLDLADRRRLRWHGRAQLLTNRSILLLVQGRVVDALRLLDEARRRRSRSDLHGRATTQLAIGVARWRLGTASRRVDAEMVRRAVAPLEDAENAFDALGDVRGVAAALNNLGLVRHDLGEREEARERWMAALDLYRQLADEPGQDCVQLNLAAGTLADAGNAEPTEIAEAVGRLELICASTGDGATVVSALAHLHLGDVAERSAEPDRATDHWKLAERILREAGDPRVAEAELRLRGL